MLVKSFNIAWTLYFSCASYIHILLIGLANIYFYVLLFFMLKLVYIFYHSVLVIDYQYRHLVTELNIEWKDPTVKLLDDIFYCRFVFAL